MVKGLLGNLDEFAREEFLDVAGYAMPCDLFRVFEK